MACNITTILTSFCLYSKANAFATCINKKKFLRHSYALSFDQIYVRKGLENSFLTPPWSGVSDGHTFQASNFKICGKYLKKFLDLAAKFHDDNPNRNDFISARSRSIFKKSPLVDRDLFTES